MMTRYLLCLCLPLAIACGPVEINGEQIDEVIDTGEASASLATATLYGIEGGQYKRININTGATTPWFGPALYSNAKGAANPGARRHYQLERDGNEMFRIRTFNTTTGALLSDVPTTYAPDIEPATMFFEVTNAGTLVGLGPVGVQGVPLRLYRLSPTTGFVDCISGDLGYGETFVSAYDPGTNRIYGFMSIAGFTGSRLVGINATTGVIEINVPGAPGIGHLRVNTQNQLIGVRWNFNAVTVVRLNPANGSMTVLSALGNFVPNTGWNTAKNVALDRFTNRLNIITTDLSGVQRLHTINASTGAVSYAVPLAGTWHGLHATIRNL